MNKGEFKLGKVDIKGEGIVLIDYKKKKIHVGIEAWDNRHMGSPVPVHPDLKQTIDRFREHVCRVYQTLSLRHLNSDNWGTDETEHYLEIVNTVNITRIEPVGGDNVWGIKIHAERKVFGKNTIKMATPPIRFEDNMNYDQAEELGSLYEEFVEGIFDYLENDKNSEIGFFSEDSVEFVPNETEEEVKTISFEEDEEKIESDKIKVDPPVMETVETNTSLDVASFG